MRALIITIIGALVPATALASGGSADESRILMWLFLSLCSLILVTQIIPGVALMSRLEKILHR